MFDLAPVLDLATMLSTKHTVVSYHRRTAHFQVFNTQMAFTCHTDMGEVGLTPLSIRMTFNKPVTSLKQEDLTLRTVVIVCTTVGDVEHLAGLPVCLFNKDFEIHGRLRKSRSHNALSSLTASNYISICATAVASARQCRQCNKRSFGRRCTESSCLMKNSPMGIFK